MDNKFPQGYSRYLDYSENFISRMQLKVFDYSVRYSTHRFISRVFLAGIRTTPLLLGKGERRRIEPLLRGGTGC